VKRLIYAALFVFISTILAPFALAQVQDTGISVQQFNTINKAKRDIKKITKGVTTETEIIKMFGKQSFLFWLEEPITKKDETELNEFLLKHIPAELKPEYPLPNIKQKVLTYIISWTFEHPVPSQSVKGEEAVQTENLVLIVTINKKSGVVEDFRSFDFYFYRKWEGSKPAK